VAAAQSLQAKSQALMRWPEKAKQCTTRELPFYVTRSRRRCAAASKLQRYFILLLGGQRDSSCIACCNRRQRHRINGRFCIAMLHLETRRISSVTSMQHHAHLGAATASLGCGRSQENLPYSLRDRKLQPHQPGFSALPGS
jgi:hypothetical protein